MISEMREMWNDGWLGKMTLIFLVVMFLSLFGVIGYCVHNEMNHLDSGRVVNMNYSPAYFTWTSTGKSSFMVYHPECYSITITDGIKIYTTSVSKKQYGELAVGMRYNKSDKDDD